MDSMGMLIMFIAFWGWTQLPTFTFWPVHLVPCAELSHHILVGLSLPMVRGGEGTKPQYGERVSKHCPHVHPLSFFSPSSLFLFQLLYALKMRDNQTSVGGLVVTQSVISKKKKIQFFLNMFYWFLCSSLHVSHPVNLTLSCRQKEDQRKRRMAGIRPGTHQAAHQLCEPI